MANIYDPAVPQSNPATPLLPSQYQDPLNLANQKQMIAQFLTMQALQPHLPQQIGPQAAKISPIAGLASVLGPILGTKAMADAAGQASAIRQQYATDTQGLLNNMQRMSQGTPGILDTNPAGPPTEDGIEPAAVGTLPGTGTAPNPQGAINLGLTSMNPMAQSLATALQSQEMARQKNIADAYASGKNVDQQLQVLGQPAPVAVAAPLPPGPKPIPPTTNFIPVPGSDGTQQVAQTVEQDPNTGAMTVTRGGTVVGKNLPQEAASAGIAGQAETLNSAQQSALLGQKIQGQVASAVRALQEGALSGGGADIKQQVSKVLQAFGVDVPSTASTDQLKNSLTGLLTDYGKIFGSRVTNLDLNNVKQYVGTLDTDPKAMASILASLSAAGIKSIQDYGSMIDARKGMPSVPGFNPDLLTGAQLQNAPMGLPGPQNLQMLTLQALHDYGGDISKYVVPGTKGETFAPNSTFNIAPQAITPTAPNAGQPSPTPAPLQAKPPFANGPNGRLGVINGAWVPVDANGNPR
jgi:hypothetical protein